MTDERRGAEKDTRNRQWRQGDVEIDGLRIHFYRSNSPGKTALLLLHGITDSGLCWTRVARDLEDAYDVVMTDARGHGASDRIGDEFSVAALARDAAGVIGDLELDRPTVFGHSMGATTATVLAAEYPDLVRALVLEDPPFRDDLPPLDAGARRMQELADLRAAPREDRLRAARTAQPGWTEEEIVPWSDSKVQFDPKVLRHANTFRDVRWRGVLARVRCPVLLVTGDPSRGAIVTPEVAGDAALRAPNLEVVRIEGAGHCIHRDRYDEIMRAVREFLAAQ